MSILVLGAGLPCVAQTPPQLLPYTARLIAGGGTSPIVKGTNNTYTCPVTGSTSDQFGDGCLATEIQLVGPRYAAADKNGNIFFSDYTNALVRRVDVSTGIVTAVAGGGTVCATATDADGDGCPSTQAKLSHPVGLAFAANGDLYFADNGYDNVRKITATNGFITTGGLISLVAGSPTTYGYYVNNTAATGVAVANTQGYLNFPYGIAFDTKGNLFIADEGNNAVEVVNLTGASETVQGLAVPAGTIAKIVGYGSLSAKTTTADCPNFVSTSSRGGCYFGLFTDGAQGVSSLIHFPYGVAADPSGNVFFSNEYYDDVGRLTPTNTLNNYAGTLNTAAKPPTVKRGTAGTFATGSPFDLAADTLGNLYFTDASNGLVWRVDGGTKASYIVAGGASAVCSGATDTYGDGCPATQATFGSSGTLFASSSSPGIFGVSVDQYSNLYVGDTVTNVVREISSGTQFGNVGVNQSVTQTLDIHFVANDGPAAANAYTLSSTSSTFTLGTAICTTNSPDGTSDCLLPVTATPTATGAFSGTLTVQSNSANGGKSTFQLGGIGVSSPFTRTMLAVTNNAASCAGATVFPTATSFTLTATIASTGNPVGTVTFFANGNQIGSPANVTNSQAQITTAFPTAGSYIVTATYNGDTYYQKSTSQPTTVTTSAPSFSTSLATSENSVKQGGTALFSFTLTQNVYSGLVTFSCMGLPANASCVFSPPTVTATGCSSNNTIVALNIYTQQGTPAGAGILPFGGGRWSVLLMTGFLLILAGFGLRYRASGSRIGHLILVVGLLLASSSLIACGNGTKTIAGTPLGSYAVTVTATGSTGGVVATSPITLTVN